MSDQRVRLRPLTEADLPDYSVWSQDMEVSEFIEREMSETTDEQRRAWFEQSSSPDGRARIWAIEVEGRHIGNCALRIEESGHTANVGMLIGDKTQWGKGYGTAAMRELLRIGFQEMNLHRIRLECHAGNSRGLRCYERSGFRYEGAARQARLKRGRWVDVVQMAILRGEWEARQRGLTPDKEWQDCMNALSPKPGEVIVDAGCGDGLRAQFIASCVAPSGRVIGIEINKERFDKAAERVTTSGTETIVSVYHGDIQSLPLSDDSADAWFCRETLEYLYDPMVALSEAIRVVRPGGRVVAMEADWDTLIYNATDKAAERKFVAVHTDHGGGPSVDGRTGRRLLSLFREAGLADVRLEVHANWSDRYSPDECYVCWPLREGHARRGLISQEELDAWYADMSAQAERGRYFYCFNYFICSGRAG